MCSSVIHYRVLRSASPTTGPPRAPVLGDFDLMEASPAHRTGADKKKRTNATDFKFPWDLSKWQDVSEGSKMAIKNEPLTLNNIWDWCTNEKECPTLCSSQFQALNLSFVWAANAMRLSSINYISFLTEHSFRLHLRNGITAKPPNINALPFNWNMKGHFADIHKDKKIT